MTARAIMAAVASLTPWPVLWMLMRRRWRRVDAEDQRRMEWMQ